MEIHESLNLFGTFLSHFITEKTGCVELFRMSSGWFNYIELHLLSENSLQLCGVQGVFDETNYFDMSYFCTLRTLLISVPTNNYIILSKID